MSSVGQIIQKKLCLPTCFQSFIISLSFLLQYQDLEVELDEQNLPPKSFSNQPMVFGRQFTRHMLSVEWDADRGWGPPRIKPLRPLQLHPAAKVLHYAQTVFEGLKAYRGQDGKVRLFRPELNMARFLKSSRRAALPEFDPDQLLQCTRHLVRLEQGWVPNGKGEALYIRPTHLGIEPALGVNASRQTLLYVLLSPVGSYFPGGRKAVSLLAQSGVVRAWPGGAGDQKMGANYAPTIQVQQQAVEAGCEQVLWLYGDKHQLTEVGTMNIFMLKKDKDTGQSQLITPPLEDGLILPGVVRDSVLQLCREMPNIAVIERTITMEEFTEELKAKRLLELFGTGTACVISPIDRILFDGRCLQIPTLESPVGLHERLLDTLNQIFYGRKKHEWSQKI